MKSWLHKLKNINLLYCLWGLLLGIFVLVASPVVVSDGYCYYHIARSIVDKGNFVSDTKPDYFDYRSHVIVFDGKVYKDVCSPGTAFALVPGLMISKQLQNPNLDQWNDYFIAYSGHSLTDGIAIILTSLVFASLTLIYLYKLVKIYVVDKKQAILIITVLIISSYVINYVFLKPFYTHTYEFFAGVVFLYNLLQFKETNSTKNLIAAAIVVSFGFAVRPFFFLPAALFGVLLLYKKQWKQLAVFALCTMPFILLWFGYNYVSYGKLITSGYNEIRGENFNLQSFNLLPLFFSPWKGWLLWSPIVVVGFAGYFLKMRRKVFNYIDFICLSTIVFVVVSYAFWPAWWGGGSYGARFMIINFPFLIPGMAYIFQHYYPGKRQWLKIFTYLCIAYTSVMSVLYLVTPNDSPKKMLLYNLTRIAQIVKHPFNYFADARYVADMEFGLIDVVLGRVRSVVKIDDRVSGEIGLFAFDSNPGQVNKLKAVDIYFVNRVTGKIIKASLSLAKFEQSKQFSTKLLVDETTLKVEDPTIITNLIEVDPAMKFSNGEYFMHSLDNNQYIVYMPNTTIRFVGPNKAGPNASGFYN